MMMMMIIIKASSLPASIEQPSDLVLKCFNGQLDLIQQCQQHAAGDFSPFGRHTWISTLWQTCCIIWEQLQCYQLNARRWCSPSLALQVIWYAKLRYQQIQQTLCRQIEWVRYCDHHDPIPVPNKHRFIWPLSKVTARTEHCLQQLKTHVIQFKNGTKITVDLANECNDQIVDKYEQKIQTMNITSEDTCCAIYELFGCIEHHVQTVCTKNDRKDWLDYQRRILDTISAMTMCRLYPYNSKELNRCQHRKPDNNHHHSHHRDHWKGNELIKQMALVAFVIIMMIISIILYISYKRQCSH